MAAPFGKYEILAPLGAGGMGEVFLARERGASGFERVVALKRLLPHMARDGEFVRLFTREALVAAQLAHSNIVPVYEFGEIDSYLYLAMEYVHGENLGTLASKARRLGRRLEVPLAAHICMQVAAALEYMHQKADLSGKPLMLVHRDVSPQNVLISFAGEVKLGDFGVAHVATSSSVADLRGKVAYMPPEQAMGRPVDARSDLYGLGAVFFELCCGRTPFVGTSNLEILEKVRTGGAPRAKSIDPRVPDIVDNLCARALSDDPADRFQDARSMRLALADIAELGGLAASAPVVLADRMRELFPSRALSPTPQVDATLAADPRSRPEASETKLGKPRHSAAKTARPRGAWTLGAALLLGAAAIGGVKWMHTAPSLAEPAGHGAAIVTANPPAETSPSRPEPTPPVLAAPPPTEVAPSHHPAHGRLSVTASVPCDVTVDGRARGRTPLADLALPAGKHQVSCEGTGLALPAERSVKIATGARTSLAFELSRINVSDLSPWADVFVDGKKIDHTPTSIRVPSGAHRIRLVGADGREVTKLIDVAVNRTVFIDRW